MPAHGTSVYGTKQGLASSPTKGSTCQQLGRWTDVVHVGSVDLGGGGHSEQRAERQR